MMSGRPKLDVDLDSGQRGSRSADQRRTNDAGYVGGERSLGRNPDHELLKERSGPRGTRDLERNRAAVGLHCNDEAEEATAAALRVDDGRNCGEEIVRRRDAPAIAIGNGDTLYPAGQQARQQSGAALLKLSGGEGDRKVGQVSPVDQWSRGKVRRCRLVRGGTPCRRPPPARRRAPAPEPA